MKAACKSIIITPATNMPIAGNVRQDSVSRGVHDDLRCNMILFQDNFNTKILFLGFDLCGVNKEFCIDVKQRISKILDIKKENILISATHTHSGPDMDDLLKSDVTKQGVEYSNWLVKRLEEQLPSISDNLEEVTLKFGKSFVYDLSFNRRLVMQDGSVKMNFEKFDIKDVVKTTGPIDPELYTISLWTKDKKLKAAIINFTLHPAILVGQDWLFSRDYINYLDQAIKEEHHKDVVVLFANGAEGNINHINYEDKNQKRGFQEAERVGKKLGNYALKNIEASEVVDVSKISCISEIIDLPMRKLTKEDMDWAQMVLIRDKNKIQDQLDGIPDLTYANEYLKMQKRYKDFYSTEIQAVSFGEIVIATLPGEVFVEIGLNIKNSSPFTHTLVFGLSNDFAGYVPNKNAFLEGGYEVKAAGSSQLDESAGKVLQNIVLELLDKVYKQHKESMNTK